MQNWHPLHLQNTDPQGLRVVLDVEEDKDGNFTVTGDGYGMRDVVRANYYSMITALSAGLVSPVSGRMCLRCVATPKGLIFDGALAYVESPYVQSFIQEVTAAWTFQNSDPMNFREYDQRAAMTVVYPPDYALEYCSMKLCSEAGEVAGKLAKHYIRGDKTYTNADLREAVAQELGDCLWYISRLASHLGYSLEEVAQMNMRKLAKRRANYTLKGDGDDR